MHHQQLGEDAWLFVGDDFESAATAFFHGDEVFLVDALASVRDAAWMCDVLAGMGKRVRMVATTHYMSDHLAGIGLFPEATTIAHRHYRHTFLSQNVREDSYYVEPDITFDGQMRVRWGRHEIRLLHNPGKTMDHVSVDVPEADLVCTGDNIVGNIVYLSKANPRLIDEAIARMQQLGRGRVISAHMGVFPASVLANARAYLAKLRDLAVEIRRSCPGTAFAARVDGIRIEDCLAAGVVATTFEREWHQNNLDLIRDMAVFELDAFVV